MARLPDGARVLVIRLRSLGDCVLTTPALALLHDHRPDLRIGVMADTSFRAVFEGNPAVADLPEATISAALSFRPHLAINFHGGTRSMQITAAPLAGQRAGFAHHAFSFLYNRPIPRAQQIFGVERTVHTAEHLASAMFYLGVPRTEIPRAQLFASPSESRPHPYAVLHPFAATPDKTWPAANFLRLAHHLRHDFDLEPVFIGGHVDDFSTFSGFTCLRGAPLAEVKSMLAGASLFVGNDSGPAHMAAAFGLPVLVLFGPSDHVVWAPWRTEHELIQSPGACAGIPYEGAVESLQRLMVRR